MLKNWMSGCRLLVLLCGRFVTFLLMLSSWAVFSFGEDVEGGPGLFDEPVAIEFHVAPDGRLDAEGTVADPFPDLEGARNAIRSRRSDGEEGLAVVWVHGGDYDYRTRPTFTLGSEDRKTVYRAVAGESLPRFTGGVRVDGSSFELVDESSDVWDRIDTLARGHLLKLDLSSYGISDFGVLRNRGFNQSMPDGHMELVVDDEMMQLGRYPNGDEFSFVASGVDSRTFVYSGNRPERWTEAEDPWLHGIWGRDWADGARAVADIDLNARQIKMTSSPTQYGISSNQYYFAFNLLEEIDEPGEYYINRDTGILYFWPDRDLSNARILLTKRSSGPIIRTNGASDITFEGLVLEASRTRLVEVVGGSTRVVFRYCRLMHAGNTAISINPQMGADGSGRNNGLYRCELKNLAGVGVFLEGGDLSSLEPGGNFVEGCRIHNFSRLSWTYRPAVSLGGVGQIVRHNEIFNAPHSAILLRSTASLVEYNHIYDVVRWSGDSAAIYGGRSWVRRRNIIRYNHIQDIASGRPKVTGIYLDDALSGTHVIGNILQGIQDRATTNNGGRDNVWSNNYIIDSDVGHYTTTMGVIQVNEDFLTAMRDVGYQQPPWSTAFPELAAIPDDYSLWTNETKAPQNTIFERNILWNNTEDISERLYSGAANPLSYYASLSDNLMGSDPMFADPQNGDFTLHFDSPAFAIPGFVEIPFGKIGRGALNVRDWPMPLDERAGQMTLSALIESDREIESVVLFYGDLDGGSESGAWSHSIVTRGPKNSGFVQVRMDLSQDEIYYARWRVIDENGVVRWTPTFGPLIGDGTGFNPIQVTEVALDDNGFIVTLDGLDVRTKYRLLRSSDLKSWTPVVGSEKFPEDSMESFIDSFSQEEKSLFYMVDRVREE